VTAAIIAVAARGPQGDADIVQVASGSRQPLRYGQLVENVQGWFIGHPLYDAKGQPIIVPDFNFPGRGRVQRQLTRAKSLIGTAEQVLHQLPLRGAQAEWGATLEERRDEVDRALGYVELYGKYAECEAVYGVE